MSTNSIDSATIEKTKQQIRSLVQEIAQLARSEMEPEQFYAEVLSRIVTALAANGGAVWTIDSERRLRLDYQINISPNLVDPQSEDSQRHFRLMQEVISKGEPRLVAPMSGAGEPDSPGNPTNTLLVVAPLQTDDSVEGVLEVFQRADSQPGSQQGYLRFLVQMSQHIGDWLKARKLKTFSDRQSFWARINNFSKAVHDSLDIRDTAYLIANEGRRLIECDRVTVTTTKAGKQVVQAVSGQDTIDTRANMITLMQTLSSKVCATGDALWYTGKTEDLPPQIERALEAYVDESHTKSLAIIPLRKADLLKQKASDELGAEEQTKYQANTGAVIGSLVVEQVDSVQSQELILPRVEEVCQQSARALGNAIEHNELFLMPVWRTIGKSRVLTTAKNLPKTLLISGLILIALLSLFILRKDFELKAEGTLEPISQSKVFVQEDGLVIAVNVEHGQPVKVGQELIVMENKELAQQFEDNSSQLQSKIEELANARNPLQSSKQQRQSVAVLEVERDSLIEQQKILLQRQQALVIKSPINGNIGTWQVKNNLLHRPVARGQEVMHIANPDGDWRLEVFLADKRIGHLNRMIAENDGKPIEVTYILKSNPDVQLPGTLEQEQIKDSADNHEQHGHSFRLFISFDKQELLDALEKKNKKDTKIKQGTEVIAKLKCGRASVGYCWFHELFEWVETMLFSI